MDLQENSAYHFAKKIKYSGVTRAFTSKKYDDLQSLFLQKLVDDTFKEFYEQKPKPKLDEVLDFFMYLGANGSIKKYSIKYDIVNENFYIIFFVVDFDNSINKYMLSYSVTDYEHSKLRLVDLLKEHTKTTLLRKDNDI